MATLSGGLGDNPAREGVASTDVAGCRDTRSSHQRRLAGLDLATNLLEEYAAGREQGAVGRSMNEAGEIVPLSASLDRRPRRILSPSMRFAQWPDIDQVRLGLPDGLD